ncbi:hypothetical protein [Aestuariibaculum marinum]|uniref:Glycosyltransferase n=1 Tax=Aestuariibaculum marinum TaxID=2683592 RepID=A0A8J6PVH5_9FLAO|nr:hypothetical protein [Aestuariibaculum marinum]MBD0823868.1 hypothetical protein [Aestuariibaculum marinum]
MQKRVLIPAKRPGNPFFESIIKHSSWQFVYGDVYTEITPYSVVLIHWPEQLFGWKEPTEAQLFDLKQKFAIWKSSARVVYVLHNEQRHLGMTKRFRALYGLVIDNVDVMVHMGNYSLKKYVSLYPMLKHYKINHPLYTEPYIVYAKEEARLQLGIKPEKKMVLVPGAIRHVNERRMILKAFKRLKLNNKLLVVPRILNKSYTFDFPGRYRLKPILDVNLVLKKWFKKKYNTEDYCFGYSFQDVKALSLYMSAADLVLIPRFNTLNSGNVFLGISFKKIVIGPETGNIGEVLKLFDFPVFNTTKVKGVTEALYSGFQLLDKGYSYKETLLKAYDATNVSKEWDLFLSNLTKDSIL